MRDHFTNDCTLENKDNYIIRSYLNSHEETKLQIGSGPNILNGWLNSDIYPHNGTDTIYLDASIKFPFPDESFDYIFSEHVIEHLTFYQASNMLQESFRILKSNGRIRIATPDIKFLIRLYTNPTQPIHEKYVKWSSETFCKEIVDYFGFAPNLSTFVINNFFRDWGHQIIYDFESLEFLVRKCGFSQIIRQTVGKSNVLALCDLESHSKIIPEEFNLLETFVLEACK